MMTFLSDQPVLRVFVFIIDLITTVFCRSTYVEGFFAFIFDVMTFFRAFFEVKLWNASFNYIDFVSASEIHVSWESL